MGTPPTRTVCPAQYLSLYTNNIGDAGFQALATALSGGGALAVGCVIDLKGNSASAEAKQALTIAGDQRRFLVQC